MIGRAASRTGARPEAGARSALGTAVGGTRLQPERILAGLEAKKVSR
jgi:hypothetical protein